MSRLPHSRKPKKQRHFRSLSGPHTLSELAPRLKGGIYITTLDGEIVDAGPAKTAGVASQGLLATSGRPLLPAKNQSKAQVCK